MKIETVAKDVTVQAGGLSVTVEMDGQGRPLTVRFGDFTVDAETLERVAELVKFARENNAVPGLSVCETHGYFTPEQAKGYKCQKCAEPAHVQVPDVCKCGHPACNHRNWEKGQCAHAGCPCGKFVRTAPVPVQVPDPEDACRCGHRADSHGPLDTGTCNRCLNCNKFEAAP